MRSRATSLPATKLPIHFPLDRVRPAHIDEAFNPSQTSRLRSRQG